VDLGRVAVDEEHVYFVDRGEGKGDSALMSVGKNGGEAVVLAFA
jgi:hypothetical protein